MAVRNVYRGTLGTTRKEQIHLTCPCGAILSAEAHRSIDVSAHPDLAARLGGRDRAQPIDRATCPECGETTPVHTRLLYHDPERRLFILVLPRNERHNELAARADLYRALDQDPAPVPGYVRDFEVVFGIAGLRTRLQERAEARSREERAAAASAEVERQSALLDDRRADLDAREAALETSQNQLARRDKDLAEAREAIARRERELEQQREALERSTQELAERAQRLEQRERAFEEREAAFEEDSARTGQIPPVQVRQDRDTEQVHAIPQASGPSLGVTAAPGDKTQLVSNPLIIHASSTPVSTQVSTQVGTQALESYEEDHESPHHAHTSEAASPFDLFDDDADVDGPVVPSPRSGEVSQVTELDPNDAIELVEGEVVVTDMPVDPDERPPPSLDPWIQSGEQAMIFADNAIRTPRLVVMADARQERALSGRLEIRIQLHALPTFPVVVLALGAHDAFSSESSAPAPIAVPMNVDDAKHHSVLTMLSRSFTLHVDVFDTTYTLIRRMLITANLEDNVRYVGEQARDHLDSIGAHDRSLGQAVAQWAHHDYDRFGWQHPERSEFREDKLIDLTSAQTVRRALAMADRFSKPEREDYLFAIRGYPIGLWQRQRRDVIARALDLGIWVGKRLGPIAVEEGLADSYEDLIERTRQNFQQIQETRPPAYDLDPDAASDNWAALDAESDELRRAPVDVGNDTRAMGRRKRGPRNTPIASSASQEVSGTIRDNSRVRKAASSTRNMDPDELMARLADKDRRVAAAIELARRRENRAVEPIMQVVSEMNRNDAVRVLGAMPSFADAATHALVQGLASHKGFIRQGCALALAIIKNETALEALSDQVISEPTAIWREIARGLGTVGPSAIMPLVSRLSKNDPGAHERVAWALAHIAARGGKRQVNQLANGRDPLAAGVAKNALELSAHAKRDDLQVRGANTPKEQTVNRAFSRSFFQALEASAPMIDPMATADLSPDTSSPAMLLDEADLLEASDYDATDEAEEMLDESDLIPT